MISDSLSGTTSSSVSRSLSTAKAELEELPEPVLELPVPVLPVEARAPVAPVAPAAPAEELDELVLLAAALLVPSPETVSPTSP